MKRSSEPKAGILLISYAKDFEWAVFAMESAAKFATGFHQRLIIVPRPDGPLFSAAADEHGFVLALFDEQPGKGMLHHQVLICEADNWMPGCDFILHLDSDCAFWAPCTPKSFLKDGKPVLYREKFEDFRASHPLRYGWKKCVFDATGLDPQWETMVRHPAVHVRSIYSLTRDYITRHTGVGYAEHILSGPNSFPQQFAEFPTLGAVAIECLPGSYHFIDHSCGGKDYSPEKGRDFLFAFWSHGGLDKECDRHPGRTAREMIKGILK